MGDPIVAPDVNATPAPAPDLTPVTGGANMTPVLPEGASVLPTGTPAPNPADIPAPEGSKIVPTEYTGGAPQAVATPVKTSNGVKAGFSSAFPQFGPDANGNIVQTNPTPRNFKGILGSVLGGALRGAAFGMAAEKGESGAAAAQRLSDQAKLQAQAEAQRNFVTQNALKHQKLQEALQTAEAVRSQKRLEMDKETHDALMQDHGVNSQILSAHLHDIKEGQANAEASWHAMMEAHGHAPLHGEVKNDNDTYVDTEGKLHTPGSDKTGETTPGVAGTSAGSVANLKGAGAKSAIAKLTTHAPNIANGNLMVTQNGELGQNSGFKLYENAKLDDVITKPAYFQTPTTMKHPDGTPVMQDHVIMPDGKTTFRTTREMLNGAEADVKAKTDQMIKTYELQTKALEPGKEAATTKNLNAEANQHNATAEATRAGTTGGASGLGQPLPYGYQMPTGKELITMTPDQLQARLASVGVTVAPEHLGSLLKVANNQALAKDLFPVSPRKGVGAMSADTANTIVSKYLFPGLQSGDAAARVSYIKGLSDTKTGSIGGNIQRLNNTINHLGDWADAMAAYKAGSVPALNRIALKLHTAGGDNRETIMKNIRDTLTHERTIAIKGASGTDTDITSALENLDLGASPEQASGNIRSTAKLLYDVANNYESAQNRVFRDGSNPEDRGRSIYDQNNRQLLNKLLGLSANAMYNGGGVSGGASGGGNIGTGESGQMQVPGMVVH